MHTQVQPTLILLLSRRESLGISL